MPADRLLSTLLRNLQTYTPQQDTPRLLGTAVALLTQLNNPLNVSLLTSQLLSAPALWSRPDGLQTCLNLMGVFHTAVARTLARGRQLEEQVKSHLPIQPPFDRGVSLEELIRSSIKGADDRSSRALHTLVLGGLLTGLGNPSEDALSSDLRSRLVRAFVTACNLAIQDTRSDDFLSGCITLSLNHAFPYLPVLDRRALDHKNLLPILMFSMLHSGEGLRSGYFLGVIDADVVQVGARQFNWPASSATFFQVQRMTKSPLLASLGALARLIAHTVEHVNENFMVESVVDDLCEFSKNVAAQWRQNKLSEMDAGDEDVHLCEEARKTTVPLLWRLMRSTLFSHLVILRAVLGRIVNDAELASDAVAPRLAEQTLRCLRDLNFVNARLGQSSLSLYSFVQYAAIDVISTYPALAEDLLRSIAPIDLGHVSAHPLDRSLDLYYLNFAENMTLVLSPAANDSLLMTAATPYLSTGDDPRLLAIFEAAHSVVLAVFSAHQNTEVTARHLPFYVDALFKAFPQNLSARQFRFAFCNLVRIVSPPSAISMLQPWLAETLLELAHERALSSSTTLLPPEHDSQMYQGDAPSALSDPATPPLSEQAVLVLTLIDSLPVIALDRLDEWLTLLASLVHHINDGAIREHCKRHFWSILLGGEMDSERSQMCAAWWTTRGGREAVLFGAQASASDYDPHVMSGAIPEELRAKI